MSPTNWYYAHDGRQIGPITLDALRQQASSGALQPGDLVWGEGMADWIDARRVPELANSFAAAPDEGEYDFAPGQSAPLPAAPYAAPQYAATPYPGVAQPGAVLGYGTYQTQPWSQDVRYAGFWLRFCAAFIDGLIIGIPLIAVYAGLLIALDIDIDSSPGAVPSGAEVALDAAFRLGFVVVGWLYFAFQESSVYMATLGKRLCGIIATDLAGQRLTFGRATGRYFGKILSNLTCYIGYIMAAFTERKQALHDMMAGALVIRRPG